MVIDWQGANPAVTREHSGDLSATHKINKQTKKAVSGSFNLG